MQTESSCRIHKHKEGGRDTNFILVKLNFSGSSTLLSALCASITSSPVSTDLMMTDTYALRGRAEVCTPPPPPPPAPLSISQVLIWHIFFFLLIVASGWATAAALPASARAGLWVTSLQPLHFLSRAMRSCRQSQLSFRWELIKNKKRWAQTRTHLSFSQNTAAP